MSMCITQDKPPNQEISFVFSQDQDYSIPLEERYEINACVDWIKTNDFSKVCLQFPDSYLVDSVEVALLIEENILKKTYILGDTSFGSCCVDEIAAQHVTGDALIHFGHACLTDNASLPVLHVLPKRSLDLSLLREHTAHIEGSCIVIYDVGYHHILGDILETFSSDNVIVPELLVNQKEPNQKCCKSCSLIGDKSHDYVRFSRSYCNQSGKPDNLVYIGSESDPVFTNFIYLFKDSQAWVFNNNTLTKMNTFKIFKQVSFHIEEIKAAGSLTIVLVSLAMKGYLESIDYIKSLAKRWKKKVYTISIAKPNVAKLTNFPEMDIFVAIGCPETHLVNNKEIIQPVVSLLEVELALNENRNWSSTYSKDFRDLLPGGVDHIPCPSEAPENGCDVSLLTGRLTGQTFSGNITSTDICTNPDKSLILSSSKTGGKQEKTWFGLDQMIGMTPVSLAVPGRAGTSTGYDKEVEGLKEL